uniref:Small ribosomal subunit protein uS3 C-terminal domain-containing protein n=1 Tax=Musa acuminata subsp. malaccensis TaxID=214687 RepID=A0A804U5N8_MUSAM
MARKGNPISVRLDLNRSSDPSRISFSSHGSVTIDSIYYYGKSVYQDVNLRSYFGSIRPPTIFTFGFRLGRCIILHFPKRTFMNFFLPRRPLRLKQPDKSRPVLIWPKKKLSYGYHDRSPSINTPISKLLRVSGAHPKYLGVVNNIALKMENDHSSRRTPLLKFFLPKKYRGPTRTLPAAAVRPSFHYLVMQYLLNTKNKMHFDPVSVLNHFVAPGLAEPSTLRGSQAGSHFERRIRSRIAFLVSSFTSDRKCLGQVKRRFLHLISLANDLRFAGTTKTTISLFPFFGATFFFPRDGVGRRIPYGYNSYLNEVHKMRYNLFQRTQTNTLIESVKIKSVCQSASLIAQDISFQPRNNPISFRSIFSNIVKEIPLIMPKGVEGIRISCSGRLGGAEIARTECGKFGKTSPNVFNQKIDYAPAEVSTRYGISGVKVRISYSMKKKGRATSETYKI